MTRVALAMVLVIVGVGIWLFLGERPMTPTLPEIGPGAHKHDGGVSR